ncbi:FAD-dependent oxidoreductase [Lactobacillus delbrueckii subsp. bulgaricus]|uniref:FAD-dependent oxidoreductase n=1 Tax=Lactobacillus delbrueckii TaxID=1584 RepID=UPI00272D319D|nr:FAD-dependent oxidoreductase [Lactobacillus delbrueckii]
MNFDIVVVGAGASGISAALTASECGAKVVLLEKGDKFGGAGMFGAQGLFCG